MTKLAKLFLPLYGIFLMIGGIKGYQKGSEQSLYAGVGSGTLALLFTALSTKKPRLGLSLGALIAAILTGVMGWRWEKTGKIMPSAVIATTSFVMMVIEMLGALKVES